MRKVTFMKIYTILVVDDQSIIRDTIKRFFSKDNYTILLAETAEEALSTLAKTKVDVVVSDQVMPGMSGTDFLTIVSQDYPDTIRIILTGYATLETAIQAINQGQVHRFFTKPCKIEALSQAIRELLHNRTGTGKSRVISTIEREHPGITKVKRDEDGAIIIDE